MVILLAVLDDLLEDDEEEESTLLLTPSLTKIMLFCEATLISYNGSYQLKTSNKSKIRPSGPVTGMGR